MKVTVVLFKNVDFCCIVHPQSSQYNNAWNIGWSCLCLSRSQRAASSVRSRSCVMWTITPSRRIIKPSLLIPLYSPWVWRVYIYFEYKHSLIVILILRVRTGTCYHLELFCNNSCCKQWKSRLAVWDIPHTVQHWLHRAVVWLYGGESHVLCLPTKPAIIATTVNAKGHRVLIRIVHLMRTWLQLIRWPLPGGRRAWVDWQ